MLFLNLGSGRGISHTILFILLSFIILYIVIKRKGIREKSFSSRILGRVLAKSIKYPKTVKVLFKRGEAIKEGVLEKINKVKIEEVVIRSPLTCKVKSGVCQYCYGWDLSTKKIVELDRKFKRLNYSH